jgi:hypothetical protein
MLKPLVISKENRSIYPYEWLDHAAHYPGCKSFGRKDHVPCGSVIALDIYILQRYEFDNNIVKLVADAIVRDEYVRVHAKTRDRAVQAAEELRHRAMLLLHQNGGAA